MNSLIAYRKSNNLLNWFHLLISFSFIIVWLPFLRAIFDGKSYQWGTNYYGFNFNGAGVTADFLFVIIQLIFYVALFVAAYRVRNRKIYYALLVLWFLNVFGNLLASIVRDGDTMFHGDTLNIHISLTNIIIPLSIMASICMFLIIRKDIKTPEVTVPWNSKNTKLALMILAPILIQAILFATGEPHGITDKIGVIAAIAQCFLIPLIFRPYQNEVESN